PCRSTRPGCERTGSVYWFAFASHRGGAPTIERVPPSCRSTRPGCERGGLGVLVCLRFAPRRCSHTRPLHPHPVGAPAPGANGGSRCIGLPSLRIEAVLLQSNASSHL